MSFICLPVESRRSFEARAHLDFPPRIDRVGAIAIVLDRACDVPYASWRLTPIYDPDPLTACVEGVDDGEIIPAEPSGRL